MAKKKMPVRRKSPGKKPSSAPLPKEEEPKAAVVEEKELTELPAITAIDDEFPPPPPAPVEKKVAEDEEEDEFAALGGANSARVALLIGTKCVKMGETFYRDKIVTITNKPLMVELLTDGNFSIELVK